MKKNLEQLTPSDGDLFQQAVEGVTPIAPSNRITPSPPVRRFQARNSGLTSDVISDGFSDHKTNDETPTSYLRAGLNSMTLRKLRRGQWPPQDSIDLHGLTSDEARRLLVNFLHHAQQRDLRCVNVIHGKGWRAEGGEGILKIRVRHWLTQHPQVLAFCEAPAYAGGGGAVWLLLVAKHKD
jgi:DNA-nicking Smr family endonuclease